MHYGRQSKRFLNEFWLENQPALPILDPTKEEKIVEDNSPRDYSYITSSHFWDFWTPLPPYVSMFLVLGISKNWHFNLTHFRGSGRNYSNIFDPFSAMEFQKKYF